MCSMLGFGSNSKCTAYKNDFEQNISNTNGKELKEYRDPEKMKWKGW